MIKLEKLEISASDEWDALVEQYPGATLFHTSFWCRVIEKTFGVKGYLLQFLDNGMTVGVVPVWIRKKAGLTLVGSPLRQTATHYCGPLLMDGITVSQILAALYNYVSRELKADYIDITFPYSLDIAIDSSWKVSKPETLILSLDRTQEDLWKSFEGRARTAIRKAIKSGVNVHLIHNPEKELDTFYEMLEEVHRRHGRKPVFPKKFYESIFKVNSEYASLYGAEYNGKWIAMAFILKYKNWMNYHSAGSLRAFRQLGANNLLQWEIIKDGLRAEYILYDLGGGSGIHGIEKFKMAFRPYRDCYTNIWRANWVGGIARKIYERLININR
ncbi:hypothetical protein DBT_1974 [Dissulfuribacter thermophilus]|uniref:BioF2-like acetyltransferase domain-containing protein n=1 Tax=Dissulfuribacter thermophilus TaxID=1156395 RepID=A0A1B9F3Y7_9BACT|nr:GNAT family N-acetyltransferase [Dissulfuribacter thermophilus]OCC14659.1 hypothetical protein DBT_1974 [Dissulfuribacter thermophilus]